MCCSDGSTAEVNLHKVVYACHVCVQLRDLRTLAADAGLRSEGSKSVIISRLWRALLEEGRRAGSDLPPWCGFMFVSVQGLGYIWL